MAARLVPIDQQVCVQTSGHPLALEVRLEPLLVIGRKGHTLGHEGREPRPERGTEGRVLKFKRVCVAHGAALLVAGMKSQELKSVGAEGTLIGTALGAAFSLWGLGSLLLYGVAYLLQLRPRLAQVCGLTGYALCGVCVPLLLGLLPLRLFYPALLLLGGASAASLGGGFATFAESPRHAPRPEA